MKDILARKKRALKTAEVQYLYAPQYETLSIDKMLNFALQIEGTVDYFPPERDWPALPRQGRLFCHVLLKLTNLDS